MFQWFQLFCLCSNRLLLITFWVSVFIHHLIKSRYIRCDRTHKMKIIPLLLVASVGTVGAAILKENSDGSIDMFAEQAYLRAKVNHGAFSRVFNVHGNAIIKGTLRVDGGMEMSGDQFNILHAHKGIRIFDIDYEESDLSTTVKIGNVTADTMLQAVQHPDVAKTGYYSCNICDALIPDPIGGDNKHRSVTEMMLRNYTALPLDDVKMAKSLTVQKDLTVLENVDLGTAGLSAVSVKGQSLDVQVATVTSTSTGATALNSQTSTLTSTGDTTVNAANLVLTSSLETTLTSQQSTKVTSSANVEVDAAVEVHVNAPKLIVGDTLNGDAVSDIVLTSSTKHDIKTGAYTLDGASSSVTVTGAYTVSSGSSTLSSNGNTVIQASNGDSNAQLTAQADGAVAVTSTSGSVALDSSSTMSLNSGSDLTATSTGATTVTSKNNLLLKADNVDQGQSSTATLQADGAVTVQSLEDNLVLASAATASLSATNKVDIDSADVELNAGSSGSIRLYGRGNKDQNTKSAYPQGTTTSGVFAKDPIACGDITSEDCGNQVVTIRHAVSTGSARYEYMIQILANTLGLNFTALEEKADVWIEDPKAAQLEHDEGFAGINPLFLEVGTRDDVANSDYYNVIGNRTDYDVSIGNSTDTQP